jgi:hypothetical protein
MISSLVNLQVDALAKKGWKLEVLQKAENNGLALRNLLLQIGKRTECPCWKKKITVFAKKKSDRKVFSRLTRDRFDLPYGLCQPLRKEPILIRAV